MSFGLTLVSLPIRFLAMKITPLVHGPIEVSAEKKFRLWNLERPIEGLVMGINPFLIELDDALVLVDLGVQLEVGGSPWILSAMQKVGFEPNQVTHILLSHLHKDHLMGLGQRNGNTFEYYFDHAKVFVQGRELKKALQNREKFSYQEDLLEALASHPRLVEINENEGFLHPSIRFELSQGHSEFHQVFWFEENGEIAFYGGDELPQYGYWRRKIAYKTDYDGKRARDLREEWKIKANEENWTVLFYHDIKKPLVSF